MGSITAPGTAHGRRVLDARDATPAAIGLAAVVVIVVACVVTGLAYSGSAGEPYSLLNHWISELGEQGVSQLAAVFNIGLILGGIGFVVFHIGLVAMTSGRLRFAIGVIGIVSGVSGALVGVFPMNHLATHRLVALAFFATGWIGPALLAARLARASRDGLPRWLAVPGLLAAVAFLAFLVALFAPGTTIADLAAPVNRPAVRGLAVLEWATLIVLLGWTACVAIVLLRRAARR